MGSNIVADTVEDGRPTLDVTLIAADQGEGLPERSPMTASFS
jgi:hypothetical protein